MRIEEREHVASDYTKVNLMFPLDDAIKATI